MNAQADMTPAEAVQKLRAHFPASAGWNVVIQASFFSYSRNREFFGAEVSEGYDCSVSVFRAGQDTPHQGTTHARCDLPNFPRRHETVREAVEEFLRVIQDRFPAVEKPAIGDRPLFAQEAA